jgi:hypothetical protein
VTNAYKRHIGERDLFVMAIGDKKIPRDLTPSIADAVGKGGREATDDGARRRPMKSLWFWSCPTLSIAADRLKGQTVLGS